MLHQCIIVAGLFIGTVLAFGFGLAIYWKEGKMWNYEDLFVGGIWLLAIMHIFYTSFTC